MLTTVCRKVAFEYESNEPQDPEKHEKKQSPYIISTLTRIVKFA